MNLAALLPYLLHDFKSEHDLILAIEELSEKFTKDRKNISDYLSDRRLVAAYCAFYLTTNIPKFQAVHSWLPEGFLDETKNCDLIDLGAGPGTMALAFLNWFPEYRGKIYQVETSKLMQEQAKRIWEGFHPNIELIQLSSWKENSSTDKFVIFGHSANEMGKDLVMDYLGRIEPRHILFIEPGTKSFFGEMLKIRDELLRQKFSVLFPCPKNERCPMAGTEDWCHQFVNVRHDPEVERLTQLVRRDRKLLPLIVHAYSQISFPTPHERVVRVFPETKFSFEWEVCHDNHLEHYQVMKKSFSKTEAKSLSGLLAGEAVETEVEKELENGKRVRLTQILK